MPVWLIALGLTVVAVATGKKSSSGGRAPIGRGMVIGNGVRGAIPGVTLPPKPFIGMATGGAEKFEDPFYDCLGAKIATADLAEGYLSPPRVEPYTIYPNYYGIPADLGQGYLKAVPNTASARVAALRARTGPAPASMISFPTDSVGAFAEGSYQNIQRVAASIMDVYEDSKNYANIAQSFGLPVAAVQAQAKDILGAIGKQQAEFVSYAAQYAPVAGAIATGIAQYVKSGSFSPAQAIGLVGNVISGIVGSVVPVAGAVAGIAVDLIVSDLNARSNRGVETCNSLITAAGIPIEKAVRETFPYPLHILSDSGGRTLCTGFPSLEEQHRMLFIENAGWGSYLAFRALMPDDKAAVQKWWATAAQFMSHPDVYNAFQKLGHGAVYSPINVYPETLVGSEKRRVSGGSIYGGVLASDEQVFLVAVPIAIANGLDPDDFARKLWTRSKGWRDANPGSFQYLDRGYQWSSNDTGDATDTVNRWSCPKLVANAWWLQWAVLARDALKLAAEMKAKPSSGSRGAAPGSGGGILSVIGR